MSTPAAGSSTDSGPSPTPDTGAGQAVVPGRERLQRLLAMPLIVLVKGYQLFISPLYPPSCRFYPSCSAYAVTALERFGPIKGSWLTVRRLLRCHPWNPGGVDHVPQKAPGGNLEPTHPRRHRPQGRAV